MTPAFDRAPPCARGHVSACGRWTGLHRKAEELGDETEAKAISAAPGCRGRCHAAQQAARGRN